ncbi:MAG: hypothetical protein QOK04_1976 [Solirubrobacteraceae bacterium]|nr:hypothetical protein [Solirubrobacteraceae bacterium]
MRVLLLTSEPVNAEMLQTALGNGADDAEVLVVAPALNESPMAFWLSDSDDAIADAERVQEQTVERLEEGGVSAAGDTGESEPLLALQDALTTFEADRIVIFAHTEEQQKYREADLAGEIQRRFGIPVVENVVER